MDREREREKRPVYGPLKGRENEKGERERERETKARRS